MFGIDAIDLIVILVLAVVLFGPEKLPQYSRKAARIFVYLRDIANNAKNTIGTELGPEYADLELKDLNPKAFIAKQLQSEVALIDEAKREVEEAQRMLKASATDIEGAAKVDPKGAASAIAEPAAALEPVGPKASPFDTEAT